MHKDDATRILRKYDIHHDLSTGKEQVKNISDIVTLDLLQLIYVRTYCRPVIGIHSLVSAKQ